MYAHLRMYVRTHKAVSDMSRSGITDQGPGIRPKEVNRMKKMKKTLANPLTKVQYRSSYSCNSGLRSFCEIGKAQPMIIMQAWKWEQLSELAKKGAKRMKILKTWILFDAVECTLFFKLLQLMRFSQHTYMYKTGRSRVFVTFEDVPMHIVQEDLINPTNLFKIQPVNRIMDDGVCERGVRWCMSLLRLL